MSIIKNLSNAFVPVRESRNSDTGIVPLAAALAEIVHDVDGDEHALINVVGTSPVMTIEFSGSVDGVNYFVIPALCLAGVGGTIPNAATQFTADTLAATNTLRVYAVRTSQLKSIRVRVSAYTSGSIDVVIRSDAQRSQHPAMNDRISSSLHVTNTGAASAAVTATLPAVVGLRHYIDRISVIRSATAVLTPSATPVLVTTTNLPGTPVLTFGSDAAAQGVDKELVLDFGGAGLACSAVNTATTVVCPIYTGVIWRVNVTYRLGI